MFCEIICVDGFVCMSHLDIVYMLFAYLHVIRILSEHMHIIHTLFALVFDNIPTCTRHVDDMWMTYVIN